MPSNMTYGPLIKVKLGAQIQYTDLQRSRWVLYMPTSPVSPQTALQGSPFSSSYVERSGGGGAVRPVRMRLSSSGGAVCRRTLVVGPGSMSLPLASPYSGPGPISTTLLLPLCQRKICLLLIKFPKLHNISLFFNQLSFETFSFFPLRMQYVSCLFTYALRFIVTKGCSPHSLNKLLKLSNV